MPRNGNGFASYLFESYQRIYAAVNGPGPGGANAEFSLRKEPVEAGISIGILVVSGSLGTVDASGDVTTL